MYLAGTIIFGGRPVVIPLLREYVVEPGWVSTRDFLIGLAIIQAFPGPNFNFAVYLGALAILGTPHSTVLGAFISYMGIICAWNYTGSRVSEPLGVPERQATCHQFVERDQCHCCWSRIHRRLPIMGDWLLDARVFRWTKFGQGTLVGGCHCTYLCQ